MSAITNEEENEECVPDSSSFMGLLGAKRSIRAQQANRVDRLVQAALHLGALDRAVG